MTWHVWRDHAVRPGEPGQIRLSHVAGQGSGVQKDQRVSLTMWFVVDADAVGLDYVATLTGRLLWR